MGLLFTMQTVTHIWESPKLSIQLLLRGHPQKDSLFIEAAMQSLQGSTRILSTPMPVKGALKPFQKEPPIYRNSQVPPRRPQFMERAVYSHIFPASSAQSQPLQAQLTLSASNCSPQRGFWGCWPRSEDPPKWSPTCMYVCKYMCIYNI